MVLVPRDTPGVTVVRPLTVFGYDDAPHGHMEVLLEDVRVPVENILLGEGRGFEIAQGRLGPGRIHHCMRSIGAAERALEMMCDRLQSRTAFGSAAVEQSVWHERIAESRCMIDQARLLTFNAAPDDGCRRQQGGARRDRDDQGGRAEHVAARSSTGRSRRTARPGLSADFWLAEAYAHQRTVRIVDGPDEVHRSAIAKIELGKRAAAAKARDSVPAGMIRGNFSPGEWLVTRPWRRTCGRSRPTWQVVLQQAGKRFRRAEDRLDAERNQLLAQRRRRHRAAQRIMDAS